MNKTILCAALTTVVGALTLVPLGAQTLYWDTNEDTGGSGNTGGAWNSGTNWSTDNLGEFASQAWVDGNNAVFSAGTDGTGSWTVTLDGTVTTPSILFRDTGTKTITGGIINVGGGTISSTGLPLSGGDDIVINSILSGGGGLSIAAHGDATSDGGGGSGAELRLNGANTFSGGFTVTRGLVSFTNSSAFGDASNTITLNGGGILMNSGGTTALPRDIIVGASGGTIRLYGGANVLNHTGALTGSTTIRRTDGGTLNMNGDGSAFTGTWNNRGGDTVFSTPNWSQMTLDSRTGGRVLFTNAGTTTVKSITNGRDLFVNNGGRLDIESGTLNLVTGAGFWIQTTNTGSLTTSNGTLTVTNGTNTGTLQTSTHDIRIPIVDFDGSTPLSLVKNNDNQLTLITANTHTGGTTINGGRVTANTPASYGTGDVTVSSGGQAWLNTTGTVANNFVINGPGVAEGAVNLGAMRLQGATVAGAINVASAARITADGSTGTHTGVLTGLADLEINAPGRSGTLTFSGDASGYTGTMTLSAGTLNAGSLGGGLTIAAGTANLSGTVAATTTIGQGATVNLNNGAQIGTPVFTEGNERSLNVNAGSTIAGDVATDFFDNRVTLNLAGTITGDVLIDDNSAFGLRGGAIGGNFTAGFDFSSLIPWNFVAPVAVTGDLATIGEQRVTLTANPPPGSPATLLTYGGTFTGDINDFTLANAANYRSVQFQNTGSAITVNTGSATRTWVGNDATNPTFWNTVTPNWAEDDNLYFTGDAVVFDDTAESTTVAMQGILSPASVTFENSTLNYNITGAAGTGFTGTTGITKNGTGSVTLAGWSHNFTGPVVINAGTLVAGSNEPLGLTSGLTVNAGGKFNIAGFSPGAGVRAYSLTIAGDGGDGAGAITNTGGAIFANAGFRNLTLSANATVGGAGRYDFGLASGVGSGTINGNGHTLTKTGTNQIVMRGPATDITYVVNQGMLTFEDFDSSSGTNTITVNGGIVNTWGARTLANDVTLATGTTFGNNGGAAANWTGTITTTGAVTMQTAANLTLSGALAGDGTITRSGANTLFLENTGAAFTGKIVSTSGGTLRVASAAAFGSGTGADILTLGGGVTLQGGTTAAQGSATIGTATQGITLAGAVNFGAGPGNTLTINSPITGTGNMQKNNNAGDAVIFNQPVSSTLSNFTSINGTTEFNQGLALTWDASQAVLRAETGTTVKLAGTSSFRELEISTATVNIVDGAEVTYNQLEMSQGGGTQSVINQTGGTVNVTGTNNTNTTSASFLMGHWGGGSASTYNLSGGTLNAAGAVMALGWDSANVNFNQTGGTANFRGINLANGRNNAAAYTLSGGRINLGATGITNASNKAVNLGGGTVGAFADWSSARNITLTGTNGSVTIDTLDSVDGTTPRSITLTGVLSGTGGIIKQGAGNLLLNNGSSNFSGTAEVAGGSLYLNGGTTSDATVRASAGGNLHTGTPGVAGSATMNALDLAGGNSVFRIGTASDSINAGSLTVSEASTISVIPTSALTVGQEFTVITYSGSIGGLGSDGITLNPIANPHYTASLDFSEPGVVKLVINSADTLTWTGATDGNWDVDTTPNWKTDSDNLAGNYYDFDVVTFDDTGSNTAITLAGTITPASVTVDADQNYSFSGSGISGTTGLAKLGTGTLTLLNNNSYLGAVSITGGSVVVGNGGTTGALGGTGGINVSTGASLTFNRSDAQTLTRAVTGGGTFLSNGGDFTLNAANNAVDIVINSGTFFARGGNWGASYAANRTITVNAPGVLDTVTHALGGLGGATRPNNIVLNEDAIWKLNNEQQLPNVALTMTAGVVNGPGDARGTGTIVTLAHPAKSSVINAPLSTGNGAITFNVADGDVAVDLSVTGNISGGNAINKNGGGTMVSTGNNTYTGPTNINDGVLQFGDGGTTGAPGTGNITNNGSLVISRSDNLTVSNIISGTGSLAKNGAGVLTLDTVHTYTGDTEVNAGTLVLSVTGGLRFAPTTNGTGNRITGSAAVELSGAFSIDLSGADLTDANTWTLVDVASLSSAAHLSSFSINGFTEVGNVHTFVDGDNTWTYTEATGVLTLAVAGGTDYDDWAGPGGFDLVGGPNDDDDGDGLSNFAEYAFGLDPTDPSSVSPVTAPDRALGTFTYTRRRAVLTGLNYTYEYTHTLAGWDPFTPPVADVSDNGAPVETITVTIPAALLDEPKLFLRVEATE